MHAVLIAAQASVAGQLVDRLMMVSHEKPYDIVKHLHAIQSVRVNSYHVAYH